MITVTITATTLLIITFIGMVIVCAIAWWINTRKTSAHELLEFTTPKCKFDKKPQVIHGGHDLELIPGKLYDIHYGVNQGVYEYLGKETKGFWEGAYTFKNTENGKLFCHHASHPYEFVGCVSLKD